MPFGQSRFDEGFCVPSEMTPDRQLRDDLRVSHTDPRIARTLWMCPVATLVTSADDGLVLDANDACCRLFGYERHQIVGQRTTELGIWTTAEDRERMVSAVTNGSSQANLELNHRRADGRIRTVLATIAGITLNGRQCLIGQMFDVTERRETEDRLKLIDRVARIGYESTSYAEILNRSVIAIHEWFPSLRVGFGSLENKYLTVEASTGPSSMTPIDGAKIDLRIAPQYERALMRGEPIVAPDVRDDVRFGALRRSLIQLGVQAVLDVPVRRADETVGVLFFEGETPTEWTPEQVCTLTDIGALLAVSLFRARAEEELRHERELIQTVMDYIPDFLYVKDSQSRFTRVNKAVSKFHGFENPDDFIGKTDFDLFPESLAKRYFADEQEVINSGRPVINRLEPQDADESIWTLTSTVPFKGADGSVAGIVGTSRDVSERRAMEEALRTSESRQRALLEAIPDIVYRVDRDGTLLDIRANKRSDLWFDPAARIGRNLVEKLSAAAAEKVLEAIRSSLEQGVVTTVEYEIERQESISTFEMRIAQCGDGEVVAIARDVTERRLLERRLAHQATHDPLTGLPNRNLFATRLTEALERAGKSDASVGVLFIDLDSFKAVNDTLGHAAGDRTLSAIADAIRRCIRSGDTVARIGGDEFAVLLDEMQALDEAHVIAARISDHIARPIRIGKAPVHTTASVGIAIGIPGRDSAESLLDEADRAMYDAKRAGRRGQSVIRIGVEPGTGELTLTGNDEAGLRCIDSVDLTCADAHECPRELVAPAAPTTKKALRYLRPKIGS